MRSSSRPSRSCSTSSTTHGCAQAHEEGTPVVVRADTPEKVLAALTRPEVACVLVPTKELTEIDLIEATYG